MFHVKHCERLQRGFAGWKIGWVICAEHRNKKFFDPAIFQKCWRGSGRVALIAARRQRNPCAMLLAHGGANKTAPPCETGIGNKYLATVPPEQLQRKCLTENFALRENGLSHPAKGGSTPAFAYQRAAIAPLPCLNLQLVS